MGSNPDAGKSFFRKAKFPVKTFSIELGLEDQLVGGLELHKMFSFYAKKNSNFVRVR